MACTGTIVLFSLAREVFLSGFLQIKFCANLLLFRVFGVSSFYVYMLNLQSKIVEQPGNLNPSFDTVRRF